MQGWEGAINTLSVRRPQPHIKICNYHIMLPYYVTILCYHIMFFLNITILCLLLLYFDYDVIGRRDFFFSCLLCFLTYSRLSSYLFHLFLYLISFLLVPYARA